MRTKACSILLLLVILGLPVPVLARQDVPEPPVSAEIRLGAGGMAILHINARDGALVPSALRTRAAEEGEGSGVQELGSGGVHLHFRARPMDDVIPLLREVRERVDALPVLIRIPGDGSAGDVWVFQARLSQAGIRQVRIVSDPGDPSILRGVAFEQDFRHLRSRHTASTGAASRVPARATGRIP